MTATPDDDEVTRTILRLVEARGPSSSICPTEAARALAPGGDWRGFLPDVRRAATGLAASGRLVILRKGKPIAPDAVRGVIRLRTAER